MRFGTFFLLLPYVAGCVPLYVTNANVRVHSRTGHAPILTDPALQVYENDVRTHRGWFGFGPGYVTQDLSVQGPVKLVPLMPEETAEAQSRGPLTSDPSTETRR